MKRAKEKYPKGGEETRKRLEQLRNFSRQLGSFWRQRDTCAMRFAAASLPFLYKEDFDALRHDRNPSVHERLIAYNFSLSADIQEKLVKSRSPRIRGALAKNKQIDSEIFLRLVNDSDREVRKNSLENPLCPQEYLVRCAGTDDTDMVRAVIHNTELPDQLILKLLERDDVRDELIDYCWNRLSGKNKFFFARCSFDAFLRMWTAPPDPFNTAQELEDLFRHVMIVGRGSSLVGELKARYGRSFRSFQADHPIYLIAKEAALCEEVRDREELFQLFSIPSPAGTAAAVKKDEMGHAKDEPFCMKISRIDMERLAKSNDREVRLILARVPELPSRIASRLIRDTDGEVRYTAYFYQPLPEDVVNAASMEADERVIMSLCRNMRNAVRTIKMAR